MVSCSRIGLSRKSVSWRRSAMTRSSSEAALRRSLRTALPCPTLFCHRLSVASQVSFTAGIAPSGSPGAETVFFRCLQSEDQLGIVFLRARKQILEKTNSLEFFQNYWLFDRGSKGARCQPLNFQKINFRNLFSRAKVCWIGFRIFVSTGWFAFGFSFPVRYCGRYRLAKTSNHSFDSRPPSTRNHHPILVVLTCS